MYMDVDVEVLNLLYIFKKRQCQKEKRSHEMFQSLHCAVWMETKVGFGPGLVKVLMCII